MNAEELKKLLGKRFKIFLKSRIVYHCILISVEDDSISIIDKFDNKVFISLDEISTMSLIGGQQQ